MRISDWSSDVCSSDLGPTDALREQSGERPRTVGSCCKPPCLAASGDRSLFEFRSRPLLGRGGSLSRRFALQSDCRSEERRLGKEWVSTCVSWWSRERLKKHK